ncbi:DUF3159 domain-containing protein [Nesterenkonia sp.]|uniref:DUF3159 domain-containing protein n=1 Tax=Nesterenkonia sp. TaxID=704201 RepID=UPI002621CCFE|nr:DUF3159 domain-containing protein [Nesterenkonia sp.]
MPNSSPDQVGHQISSAAAQRLSTRDDGSLDVHASVGGWRGLAEAALPSAGFLVTYLITEDLTAAILLALGTGLIFTVLRLIQRGSLLQSVSGLIGVAICAAFAHFSGDARGYYQPGFFVNAAYLAVFAVSVAVKWPFMGILFGLIRGEGLHWRHDDARRRGYAAATWIVAAVLAARLLVQVPLYLADEVAALGVTRIVMGVPLYALALWLGWMITRPQPAENPSEHQV